MLDIVIVIILLIGAIRGYIKGFFIQSLTLVALILGIWMGIKFNPLLTEWLIKIFGLKASYTPYVSFVIIFIIIVVAIHYLGVLFTKVLDKQVIGTLNHIGGLIFGIVKMAFLTSICLFLFQKFDTGEKYLTANAKKQSKFYEPISKIAPAIFPHIQFEKFKRGILGN
jgi:membrane protein required for colicin V production